ncbi:MAG TPA: DUF4383 domain-containing protein [Azospirillaceae bacterium]|nr:DUF4383 domain-containing protein [Azospirillaceae bacterium]
MTTRTIALILGIGFLVAGLAGFFPGVTPQPAADPAAGAAATDYPRLFGLFPVNTLHNIAHLLFGVWGIVAYRSWSGSRTYNRVTAVVYAVLMVFGLIPGLNTLFGLMPLFSHDVWLHLILGGLAAYGGFAARETADDRVTAAGRGI